MGGKIFNNKKINAIIGKKSNTLYKINVHRISNDMTHTIKGETLKKIHDAITALHIHRISMENEDNIVESYEMRDELEALEKTLVTELEVYAPKEFIDDLRESIRVEVSEQINNGTRGQIWTTNTTTIGDTMPQLLPGEYLGTMTDDISLIPDGASTSDIQQMPSGWGGLLPKDNDE